MFGIEKEVEAKTKIADERCFRPEHQGACVGMHAIRADNDIEPLFRPAFEADVYSGAIVAQRFDGVIKSVAGLPVAREIVQN